MRGRQNVSMGRGSARSLPVCSVRERYCCDVSRWSGCKITSRKLAMRARASFLRRPPTVSRLPRAVAPGPPPPSRPPCPRWDVRMRGCPARLATRRLSLCRLSSSLHSRWHRGGGCGVRGVPRSSLCLSVSLLCVLSTCEHWIGSISHGTGPHEHPSACCPPHATWAAIGIHKAQAHRTAGGVRDPEEIGACRSRGCRSLRWREVPQFPFLRTSSPAATVDHCKTTRVLMLQEELVQLSLYVAL